MKALVDVIYICIFICMFIGVMLCDMVGKGDEKCLWVTKVYIYLYILFLLMKNFLTYERY